MRVNIIIPITSLSAGNQLAYSITSDPADLNTFGAVELSANGLNPVTHTGCSTFMSESFRVQLPAMAASVSGLVYNVDDTFDNLLSQEGLQKIVPPGLLP